MVKIMLVEDDKSLREIYGARLLAEGYDIVSAGDGEEALAIAIKEKPGLIISDVMMPKISGFDMLDILRSSSETRNTKVIMMTALSSDDQRIRGEQLGADRYLVKSQVGIEDVVRVVHEVLEDGDDSSASAAPSPIQPPAPAPQPAAPAEPSNDADTASTPVQAQSAAPADPASQPQTEATQDSTPEPAQAAVLTPSASRNRTIQPLNDPHKSPIDIHQLLDKELAKEAGVDENSRPEVSTTEQERTMVDGQINQYASTPEQNPAPAEANANAPAEAPAAPAPTEQSPEVSDAGDAGDVPPPPPPPPMPEQPATDPSTPEEPSDPAPPANPPESPPPPPRPPVAL